MSTFHIASFFGLASDNKQTEIIQRGFSNYALAKETLARSVDAAEKWLTEAGIEHDTKSVTDPDFKDATGITWTDPDDNQEMLAMFVIVEQTS